MDKKTRRGYCASVPGATADIRRDMQREMNKKNPDPVLLGGLSNEWIYTERMAAFCRGKRAYEAQLMRPRYDDQEEVGFADESDDIDSIFEFE